MPDAESDAERTRREYNAAVANGLVMRAGTLARRLDALERTPPGNSDMSAT